MKKILVLLAVVAFVVVLMSSCKSADCPAYSKADMPTTEQNNA